MTSQWRWQAAPIITRVVAENRDLDDAALRKKIHAAYPFGRRRYNPYKMWLLKVKKQLSGQSIAVDVKEGKRLVFGSKTKPYGEGGSV